MREKIKGLIDLKTIVTLVLTGLLVYGLVTNKFESKDVMTIIVMVFTFYFSKKDNPKTETKVEEVEEELVPEVSDDVEIEEGE